MVNYESFYQAVLGVLSLAFFISFCINVILCYKQRSALCTDKEQCCYSHNSGGGGSLSQMERGYFHDLNHEEQQENPRDHREQQENPIYGNISAHRSDSAEDCYEMMTLQRTRNCVKTSEPDLNYASLDLKKAKKRKKKHGNVQEQLQSRHQPQDRGAPPANVFLEVDADVEPHLPDRDASTMVSHSSIYLNSQQIAMETEEMQREQQEPGWEEEPGRGGCGGCGGWEGQETEERTLDPYGGSEDTCAPLSEAETIDLQTESFNDDNN